MSTFNIHSNVVSGCRSFVRSSLVANLHGHDFRDETFRVLKEEEQRQFREYRTRRLVLEAWDRLTGI